MPSIADPLALPCGTKLPNRLCKAAMTEALADPYSRATPELCRLYERWSAGGTGLLITGNVQVDRRYLERPGNLAIDGPQDDEKLMRLRALAAAGKAHGSKVFVQLGHAGRQSTAMTNLSPVGPGDVPLENPHGLPSFIARHLFGSPRALTAVEVTDVVTRFADAAAVCCDTGFDGVQIHAAHGYLLSSFLNPRANNRVELFGIADPYSGSLENRAKVLLDVVRAVRERVGSKFAVSVKLNSADFQKGGFSTEEASVVAVWLEQAGIDLLEISGGNYESGIYSDNASQDALGEASESTRRREAYFLRYAVKIRTVVRRVPVMVTGGWRTREAMEDALRTDSCALIGIGRPLCGDPDGSRKLLDGSICTLPRYEDTLKLGYSFLQWILVFLPVSVCKFLRLASLQCWYYRNIVHLAQHGVPQLSLGTLHSFVANNIHEARQAKKMRGVDCKGTFKWR